MPELHRDQIDAKIFFLREKYKDKKTLRTDMSEGSPFHQELTVWLEEQAPTQNYPHLAVKHTESYTRRHQPNQEPETLPIYEPQAILALSIKKPVYITEADSKDRDLDDHLAVRDEVKARHDMAHARWTRFIRATRSRFRGPNETWAQMEAREAREAKERGDQDKAAD
jgi:hypothetical protein